MVPSSKLEIKKSNLAKALKSFELAIRLAPPPLENENIDEENFNDEEALIDLQRNGLLQKFEYNVELFWKTLQNIYKEKGLILDTPKDVLRQAFTLSNLEESEKIQLLKMIDHRNTIAHEYKEFIMKEIYPRIPNYFLLMKKLYNCL